MNKIFRLLTTLVIILVFSSITFSQVPTIIENQAVAPPQTPTGFTAKPVSSTQVNLSWTAVSGATSYTTTGYDGTKHTGITGTTDSFTGQPSGSTITYYVTASNVGGTSGAASASAMTFPAVPTNFTATAVSSTQVNLSWKAVNGASSYTTTGYDGTKHTGITGTTDSFTGQPSGMTITYYVTANDAGGSSGAASASATTPPQTYTLTVTATNGTVAKNPNQTSYNSGTTVQLTATPATGYTFTGWSGDASGTTNPLTVTMNGNKNITANFTPIQYTLTVTAVNGTVVKNPNQTSYNSGTTVQLTATPATNYTFTGWSGDASGTTNPLTVTMNGNKNITANFTPIQYTLTVTAANGTVVKNPNQTSFNSGSTVQLTATPATGYTFTGWSGDASGTTNPLTVTMNGNKNITANFILNAPTGLIVTGATQTQIYLSWSAVPSATKYTVYQDGTSISVTNTNSDTAVVSCGTTHSYYVTAGNGSGWSGASNTVNGTAIPCNPTNFTATVISSTQINLSWNAVYGATSYKLIGYYGATIYTGPNTSYSDTVACGVGHIFYSVTASNAGGTSGADTASATPPPCIQTYTLTVNATNGTVVKSPDQTSYNSGTIVQLTATPATGYTFTGWNGDTSGTTNPITVTMNRNKNITANFFSPLIRCGIYCSMDGLKTNAISTYGPAGQGWSAIDLGWWFDGNDWANASSSGYNPKNAILCRDSAVAANYAGLEYEIYRADTNNAQWVLIDDGLTKWKVYGDGQLIQKTTMDSICLKAHRRSMQVAVAEDYTTVFNNNSTYLDTNWTFYQNVDIIMPYGYDQTPSELGNFYKYLQTKGKKVVPCLGYNVHKNGNIWSQKGQRSGDSAFIDTAQKYADDSIVFYYVEPELDFAIPGNWAAEWDSTGGLNQYLYSITLYLQGQNYMIRNFVMPNYRKGGILLSAELYSTIAKSFQLFQNYPNPFNPISTIKYQIPKDGLVKLKVYDILGREVAELVNEKKQAGYYQVDLDASKLASGIYIYRIQAGEFSSTKKMVLMK